jgi:hypothetical protein
MVSEFLLKENQVENNYAILSFKVSEASAFNRTIGPSTLR